MLGPVLDSRHRVTPFSECVPLSNATKSKGQKQTRCSQAAPVENNVGCSLLHPPLERLDFISHPLHPLSGYLLCPLLAVTFTWMWLSAQETLESIQHGGSTESSVDSSCISQSTFSSPSWSLNLGVSSCTLHPKLLCTSHSAVAIFLNEKLSICLPNQQLSNTSLQSEKPHSSWGDRKKGT